jgi:hypothetical protein
MLRFAVLLGVFSCLSLADRANADIVVTWENNAGDLVVRWNGNISNWAPQSQPSILFVELQTNNGLHALGGAVDLSWTGSAHNWYIGPILSGGVLVGDSFGSGGSNNWVYMPFNYAGQSISGSATFAGQGGFVGSFVAGSRDLGFGQNDNIIFRAASVPEPTALATLGVLGLVGLSFQSRRRRIA